MTGTKIPLVTDLDGTLVRGDTLVKGIRLLLCHRPWLAPLLPFWVLGGRPFFKRKLAAWSARACGQMPLNRSVLDLLDQAAAQGTRRMPLSGAMASRASITSGILRRTWPYGKRPVLPM